MNTVKHLIIIFFFGVPHSATFIFVIFVYVIASIAYIHPVYGAASLNPRPRDRESSAFTTRPWLLPTI